MTLYRANHILEKEWDNLRGYFETCGDIGNYHLEDIRSSRLLFGEEEGFISNVINMENKRPKYGYATPEALNVFTVLASIAAAKLGLEEEFAPAFGEGYGFARTGFISYYRLNPKQILFYKMFFPLGGAWDLYSDIYPDLYPNLIQKRLRHVLDQFKTWQNNPQLYTRDLVEFQNIEEGWKAWDETW
jgi:hypothetical protein